MDELRLAQLLNPKASDERVVEILKDLDVNYAISNKSSAIPDKLAFSGYNCLHIAVSNSYKRTSCCRSDLNLTEKLLELGSNLLQQGTQDGKTPLHKAVDYVQNRYRKSVWKLKGVLQKHSLVDKLLSAQVKSKNPFNAKCKSGISHLHIACMFNHTEAVMYFTRFDESVNQTINADSNILPGYTPLHCAVRYSSSETAIILLTLGADIYLENVEGMSSVCYLLERLLDANDNLRMTDGSPCYPYDKEIERLNLIMKTIILKNETDDSKLVEKIGLSAFQLSCTLKDNWIMQSYITYGFEDINTPVSSKSKLWAGWTPLHFAVCCSIHNFEILWDNGADIGIKNVQGDTAFDLVLQRFSPKVLLSHLSIDTAMSDKCTKLSDLMLVISSHKACQKFLQNLKDINLTVPLDSPFWPGYNLLHISLSMHHKVKYAQIFREETDCYSKPGYGVNLPENCSSVNSPYWPRIKILLEKGCSVYAKNADGLTPIHLAFKLDEWQALEELLVHARENVVGPDNLSFLHIACVMGKKDVIEELLKKGADVNSPVARSFECYRKLKLVSEINNQSPLRRVLIRANSTPLHIAVLFAMEEAIEKLMKKRADVHAKDELGLTPLHLSLASTKSIAKLLLNGTLNLRDVKTEDGLSHLHVAAFANNEKSVRKLLKAGADVNGYIRNTVPNFLATFAGKTPLHLAIGGEKAALVLLSKGANLLAENPYLNYETPLDSAVRNSNSGESKLLFDKLKSKEIRIDALTISGLTTLHIACATFDLDWARKLLLQGANSNARMKDNQGEANTPMHLLIANAISTIIPANFRLIIELLLEYGADVGISKNRKTPLHLIADIDFEEKRWLDAPDNKAISLTIADLLLSNQKSYAINPTDSDGFSHFHFACMTNNLAVVKKYLDNGVNVNHSKSPFADGNGGWTPLHFATNYKNRDVVRLLIQHGADVRVEDSNGNTPLHTAVIARFTDLQVLDALLRKGADINARNLKNKTPIQCLIIHKNITHEEFHFFIQRGSLIDPREKISWFYREGIIGLTMQNTIPSDVQLVFETFIECSSVKVAVDEGFLLIHDVVSVRSENLTRKHYLNAIQRLVEKGVDIDEQDEYDKSPLEQAISYQNNNAIEALLLLGANVNVNEKRNGGPSVASWCECSSTRNESVLFVRNHVWKMSMVKLDLDISIEKAMTKEQYHPDENAVQLYQTELEKTSNTKICESLNVRHFLSEWGAIVEYSTMSVAKRQTVDEFFKRADNYRKEFPEFAGILAMQYRKALARVTLMQPVMDILVEAGIDLPNICLEAILKYFKNFELKFWIENADDVLRPCKRRKIQ